MSLKQTYTLMAPVYDALIDRPSRHMRRESLARLPKEGNLDILLAGIGTGLDLPCLPLNHRYVGIDLTPAMLRHAFPRRDGLWLSAVVGDCRALPFDDARFDHVVAHLIIAVTGDPAAALRESARVLRPGGSILVLDKFLHPGQTAPVRRALNPLSRRIATRLDVVFEDALAQVPDLKVVSDEPVLAHGWFRSIKLVKS